MNLQPTIHELTWIVTLECQLKCRYCYVSVTSPQRASDSSLSRAAICDILGQARVLGAHTFMLRGGEPFLRSDLVDILQVAELLGYASELFTKAVLSPKIISKLAELRGLSLGVSLDTIEFSVGDRLLRKQGHTKLLMDTVRRLCAAGAPPSIEATVTPQTLPHLNSLRDFCIDTGVRHLHLRTAAPHKVQPMDEYVLTAQMIDVMHGYEGSSRHLPIFVTPAFSCTPSCGEGLDALTFLPDGTVTKCTASLSMHPSMIYGNLAYQTVLEVMRGQRRAALLQKVVDSGSLLESHQRPVPGRLPCSQLVSLEHGSPFGAMNE